MRVLIVSALLAYAAAAPSGVVPLVYQTVAVSGVPAAVPTISPGDIQAAAINAQVQVNDLARAAADKAQELADQAVENVNGRSITDVNQANEKNEEAFWSNEEKKWQALDALKTAEAQIDGAAASNADVYARSTIGAVLPYAAAVGSGAPVVAAPIPPVIYNPYFAVKTVSTQTVEVKAEEKKEDKEEVTVEAAVKTAEPEKSAEPEKPAEPEKTETPIEAAKPEEKKSFVVANPVFASFPSVYSYNVVPGFGQVVAQPVFKYASVQPGYAVAPTYVQTVW